MQPAADSHIAERLHAEVRRASAPSLRPLINATGVVLHTNLGRAPLAAEALRAMKAAAGYGNVEFDLESGLRGSRYAHCADLIKEVTGAEDALVVNNGAGAMALALTAFAHGKGVVVSHGELVEIGGGFRIPEVVEAAGARLVPVGTTNKTRLADYARAVADGGVGAILKVHRSNFRVTGFVQETPLKALVALGAETGTAVIHDLGSGLLLDAAELGLPSEPTPSDSIVAGVHLVTYSGDKLLGGPQAGILAGTREGVARAKSHPLCRALRSDKVTLAGLGATLALYRNPARARQRVPVLRMLSVPLAELEQRAHSVCASVAGLDADVQPGDSLVGGGTFPGVRLPTALLAINASKSRSEHAWLAALRGNDPPIIARGRDGRVLLDFRTIAPDQDAKVAAALVRLVHAEAR